VSRAPSKRAHLSIGEVLSLLREEFPDVTISKIRFLESQGLLDPERTPSGYRKFYETDINTLRWILRQQKENYLPLKVIKDRLSAAGEAPALSASGQAAAPEAPQRPEAHARPRNAVESPATASAAAAPKASTVVADPAPPAGNNDGSPAPVPPADPPGELSLTAEELAQRSGLKARDLRDLERYGLVESFTVGDVNYYDSDALVVAQTASHFLQHGIEARHMRTYKVAVDREAGLFEQIVLPLLKQRNPEARQRARDTIGELVRLGQEMRAVLLSRELRDVTGPG
jgi:DNA-binding transcriptional MerR regulator